MKFLSECYLCGNKSGFEKIAEEPSGMDGGMLKIPEGIYSLWKCQLCGGHLIDSKIDENYLWKLYNRAWSRFILDTTTVEEKFFPYKALLEYKWRRLKSLFGNTRFYRDVNRFSQKQTKIMNKKCLDIGCQCGHFSMLAEQNGWDVWGIDIGAQFINYIHNYTTLKKEQFINNHLRDCQFKNNFYDVVTLFEVIEHIKNFKDELKETYRILKPNGIVIISVPSAHFTELKWLVINSLPKKNKKEILTHSHLYNFTPRSLEIIMKDLGFSNLVFKVVPLIPEQKRAKALKKLLVKIWGLLTTLLFYISDKRYVLTSEIMVIARK